MNWIADNWDLIAEIVAVLTILYFRIRPSNDDRFDVWDKIVGYVSGIFRNKSKVEDEGGKKLSHREVRLINRLKKDKKLKAFFNIRDSL